MNITKWTIYDLTSVLSLTTRPIPRSAISVTTLNFLSFYAWPPSPPCFRHSDFGLECSSPHVICLAICSWCFTVRFKLRALRNLPWLPGETSHTFFTLLNVVFTSVPLSLLVCTSVSPDSELLAAVPTAFTIVIALSGCCWTHDPACLFS